jgi:hypothetical protein
VLKIQRGSEGGGGGGGEGGGGGGGGGGGVSAPPNRLHCSSPSWDRIRGKARKHFQIFGLI